MRAALDLNTRRKLYEQARWHACGRTPQVASGGAAKASSIQRSASNVRRDHLGSDRVLPVMDEGERAMSILTSIKDQHPFVYARERFLAGDMLVEQAIQYALRDSEFEYEAVLYGGFKSMRHSPVADG
jgi:hypothetical protein